MPDPAERIRCFIAIPVDEAIVTRLCAAQEELSRTMSPEWVRWTSREQMHLTLKFLGSVPAGAMSELGAAFRSACAGTAAFTLVARELGGFPSIRQPRVLWVGLAGETEPLLALQSRIDAATLRWTQKPETRAFRPHLTLGRVREEAARHARRIGAELARLQAREFGAWRAAEVLLIRSHLSPKGSTYTTLTAVSLGTS